MFIVTFEIPIFISPNSYSFKLQRKACNDVSPFSDVALIITFLLDLHDVIGLPRLVEELDVGSVKADDRNRNENCFFWIVEFFLFSQRYDNFV